MFDRCYCIKTTIYLLQFEKLYGTIFCHRLAVSERVHIFFKYPSSWSEPIKRFKMAAIIRLDLDVSKMSQQGGCCTAVVVQNELQIHQQKRRNKNGVRPTLICNNFHAELANPFLCHPAVLGSRHFATCFLSQLFYSQFDIVKI